VTARGVAELVRVLGAAALIAGCGDDVTPSCVIEERPGEITLVCPDGDVTWAVPWCGNGIVEAGEDCDERSLACTGQCQSRPGVDCAVDEITCLCDPALHPDVPERSGNTFYYYWLSFDGPMEGGFPFDGATAALTGPLFTMYAELGFSCDLGSGAPMIVVANARAHAWVALPLDAIDADVLAAVELTAGGSAADRRYSPVEWVGRTLVVADDSGRPWAVEIEDYLTPCVGVPLQDQQLLVTYRARALRCPPRL
jgi:hypothetical protein